MEIKFKLVEDGVTYDVHRIVVRDDKTVLAYVSTNADMQPCEACDLCNGNGLVDWDDVTILRPAAKYNVCCVCAKTKGFDNVFVKVLKK